MTIPAWYTSARAEIGVREIGSNRGPDIKRYITLAHVGQEGWPWCAIFANAMLEKSGVPGTRSAGARSFEWDSKLFVPLKGPVVGAIVTFWRQSPRSGLGHVGFYVSETKTQVNTLGGNEHDSVREELLPKAGNSFGLVGYWWPKSVELPIPAPVQFSGIQVIHQPLKVV